MVVGGLFGTGKVVSNGFGAAGGIVDVGTGCGLMYGFFGLTNGGRREGFVGLANSGRVVAVLVVSWEVAGVDVLVGGGLLGFLR